MINLTNSSQNTYAQSVKIVNLPDLDDNIITSDTSVSMDTIKFDLWHTHTQTYFVHNKPYKPFDSLNGPVVTQIDESFFSFPIVAFVIIRIWTSYTISSEVITRNTLNKRHRDIDCDVRTKKKRIQSRLFVNLFDLSVRHPGNEKGFMCWQWKMFRKRISDVLKNNVLSSNRLFYSINSFCGVRI